MKIFEDTVLSLVSNRVLKETLKIFLKIYGKNGKMYQQSRSSAENEVNESGCQYELITFMLKKVQTI